MLSRLEIEFNVLFWLALYGALVMLKISFDVEVKFGLAK
jgi:hypothetical protein